MPHLRTCLAATVAALVSTAVISAPLPVKIERFEGEVVEVVGTVHSGVLPGGSLQAGTQIQTGADGHAELSLNAVPTVAIGADTDLLVHSVEGGVLRLRVAGGVLRVDARSAGSNPARDVRLNVGDLRLRISGADAWTELSDRGGQICLISGVVEAQQPSGAVRLDVPGQCLRQSGLTSQWSMVPLNVLEERVALLAVREPKVAAVPKPEPKIKALPLPIEPEPPQVAVVQPPPAVEPSKPVVIAPVVTPPPVVIERPSPPPASAPVAVAAAPSETPTPAVKIAEPAPAAVLPPAPAVAAKPAPIAKEEVAVVMPPPPAEVKNPEMPVATDLVAMAVPSPIETPVWPEPPAPVIKPPPAAVPVLAEPKAVVAPSSRPQPKALPADDAPSESVAASAPVPQQEPAAPVAAAVPATEPAKPAPSSNAEVAMAEPAAAAPVVDDGRRWRVVVGSMPEADKANAEMERLNARGWAVEAREYRVGDRHGYRIGFGEFVAREDAQRALDDFVVHYPEAAVWLAKY